MASYCVPGNTFCVYGEVVNQEIHYTIHSAARGWTGFGVGASMDNADMYVAWKGSSGDIVFSRRTSTGFTLPQVSNSLQGIKVIPLKKTAPSWANLAYSFSRPLSATPAIGATSAYMYAFSDVSPAFVDVAESSFGKHSEAGNINALNVLVSGSSSSSTRGAVSTTATSTPTAKSASTVSSEPLLAGWIALVSVCLYGLGFF